MSKAFKILYKIIYDDLKDADMLIDYSKKLKEEDKRTADSMITNAKTRLAHAMSTHEQFVQLVNEEKGRITKDSVTDCLWEETHEHYTEWYNDIEECIKKWK